MCVSEHSSYRNPLGHQGKQVGNSLLLAQRTGRPQGTVGVRTVSIWDLLYFGARRSDALRNHGFARGLPGLHIGDCRLHFGDVWRDTGPHRKSQGCLPVWTQYAMRCSIDTSPCGPPGAQALCAEVHCRQEILREGVCRGPVCTMCGCTACRGCVQRHGVQRYCGRGHRVRRGLHATSGFLVPVAGTVKETAALPHPHLLQPFAAAGKDVGHLRSVTTQCGRDPDQRNPQVWARAQGRPLGKINLPPSHCQNRMLMVTTQPPAAPPRP